MTPSETGLSIYFRDITARRERERRLEKSERRYRTLAEHFPNGFVTPFDQDLSYTLAAGRAFSELPASPMEVVGSTPADVWGGEVAADLKPAPGEVEFRGRIWRVWTTPLRGTVGDVFAGLSFAQDITEQVERQEQLEESNERLEQFAYTASHDLQEPLRMVSSYLRLIEHWYSGDLDEEGEEFLEFAVDGADRIREMIEGLLEYSRVDSRGNPFESVDLNALIADVRSDLRMRIEETDAEITVEDLPSVAGDASQLRQVFKNLLSNAITYSGEEAPRIRVEAERRGRM